MILYGINEIQFNTALYMICERYEYHYDWYEDQIKLKIDVYFSRSPIMQNSHIVLNEEDLMRCDSTEELYKLIFDTWMKTGGMGK